MSKKTTKATESELETTEVTEVTGDEPEATEDTEGLVKMHKDEESLHVHPTTVDAHKHAGWKVA